MGRRGLLLVGEVGARALGPGHERVPGLARRERGERGGPGRAAHGVRGPPAADPELTAPLPSSLTATPARAAHALRSGQPEPGTAGMPLAERWADVFTGAADRSWRVGRLWGNQGTSFSSIVGGEDWAGGVGADRPSTSGGMGGRAGVGGLKKKTARRAYRADAPPPPNPFLAQRPPILAASRYHSDAQAGQAPGGDPAGQTPWMSYGWGERRTQLRTAPPRFSQGRPGSTLPSGGGDWEVPQAANYALISPYGGTSASRTSPLIGGPQRTWARGKGAGCGARPAGLAAGAGSPQRKSRCGTT